MDLFFVFSISYFKINCQDYLFYFIDSMTLIPLKDLINT